MAEGFTAEYDKDASACPGPKRSFFQDNPDGMTNAVWLYRPGQCYACDGRGEVPAGFVQCDECDGKDEYCFIERSDNTCCCVMSVLCCPVALALQCCVCLCAAIEVQDTGNTSKKEQKEKQKRYDEVIAKNEVFSLLECKRVKDGATGRRRCIKCRGHGWI